MKTLDEVIETAPYVGTEWTNDALYYLKAYKDDKDDLTALRAYWAEQQANPPLTWDELKQMEGKPVWVEDSNGKGEWVLLSGTEDEYLYFVYRDCAEYKIYRDEQGIRWQAYRKERHV